MPEFLEDHIDNFTISTEAARLDLEAVTDMLARAYWSHDRRRETVAHSLQNSLVFGLYDGTRQIGLARIVSDYATFAYLCDVFIHEDYRGRGLGKWLIKTVTNHPDLRNVRHWLLATRDAHGLYAQFGWIPVRAPEKWMERINE
jgi:GNAT superfamily N-acetyltransferase